MPHHSHPPPRENKVNVIDSDSKRNHRVSSTFIHIIMNALVASLLLSFVIVNVMGDMCLECICELESNGCTNRPCAVDPDGYGQVSCGYFQIKLDYYKDCYEPWRRDGETVEVAWKRCAANKDCSIECLHNFMDRYGNQCRHMSSCEKIARLHNGGPNGCSLQRTDWYWQKISDCLRKKM